MSEKRFCLECKEELLGRADQKFCSDYCRNAYNNSRRSEDRKHIKRINKILTKNRDLLLSLCPEKKASVIKLDLAKKGFDFNYFTNIYRTKTGKTYFYCYDYGYTVFEDNADRLLIVKKEEYV